MKKKASVLKISAMCMATAMMLSVTACGSKEATKTPVDGQVVESEAPAQEQTDAKAGSIEEVAIAHPHEAETDANGETLAELDPEKLMAEAENQQNIENNAFDVGVDQAASPYEVVVSGTVKEITEEGVYLVTLSDGTEIEFYVGDETNVSAGIGEGADVVVNFDGVTTRSIPAQAHNVKELLTPEDAEAKEVEKQESIAQEIAQEGAEHEQESTPNK